MGLKSSFMIKTFLTKWQKKVFTNNNNNSIFKGQSSNTNFYTTKTQKGCETTEVGLASYDEQISIYIVGNNIVTYYTYVESQKF